MIHASQLSGGPSTRYKMKQVEIGPLSPAPEAILSSLEEFHEEGWEVCGVSLAYDGPRRAVWIFYRRVA